jgi:hypothetical protein
MRTTGALLCFLYLDPTVDQTLFSPEDLILPASPVCGDSQMTKCHAPEWHKSTFTSSLSCISPSRTAVCGGAVSCRGAWGALRERHGRWQVLMGVAVFAAFGRNKICQRRHFPTRANGTDSVMSSGTGRTTRTIRRLALEQSCLLV